MKLMNLALIAGVFGLAACDESFSSGPLPENVRAIAAPSQDLNSARIDPNDNCYWYEYKGPVETTMLPLRTTRGNPICVKQAS